MLDWFQLANNKENKTIQLRRYLHQYPELSFEEFQTHDYIVNQLSQLSCDIETPIAMVSKPHLKAWAQDLPLH